MSCFIVEPQTISRIVTWLSFELHNSRWLVEKLKERGFYFETEFCQKLGMKMMELNVKAFEERYGEKLEAKYTYCPQLVSPIQVYKSLSCWNYQCSQGDVPEEALYKLFEEIVKPHLSSKIITSLPEYNQAEWA